MIKSEDEMKYYQSLSKLRKMIETLFSMIEVYKSCE